MKTLGNKSLSGILSVIIQIVWWLEWFGAVVITAALIIMPFFKKNVGFNTPVTFATAAIKTVSAAGTDFENGQLNATEGSFSFQIQPSLSNILIMIFIVVVAFSFFILATYQLRLIFLSFAKNEPFVEFNITRIRKIGFILIGYALAQLLYHIALNQYLINHFKWSNDILLTYSFNLSALFTGVTLIVVAEVFKLGTSLDNEQKLTI